MKLHIPMKLRTALLSCLGVITTLGTTLATATLAGGLFAAVIAGQAEATEYEVNVDTGSKTLERSDITGLPEGSNLTSDDTFTKTGAGTLIINGDNKGLFSGAGTLIIEAGTLRSDFDGAWRGSIADWTVLIKAGAALNLTAAEAFGWDPTTNEVSLTGESGKVAQMIISGRQEIPKTLQLNGFAEVSSADSSGYLFAYASDTKLVSTGSNNVVSANISLGSQELTFEVEDTLTFSGRVFEAKDGQNKGFTKTGAGTLVFAALPEDYVGLPSDRAATADKVSSLTVSSGKVVLDRAMTFTTLTNNAVLEVNATSGTTAYSTTSGSKLMVAKGETFSITVPTGTESNDTTQADYGYWDADATVWDILSSGKDAEGNISKGTVKLVGDTGYDNGPGGGSGKTASKSVYGNYVVTGSFHSSYGGDTLNIDIGTGSSLRVLTNAEFENAQYLTVSGEGSVFSAGKLILGHNKGGDFPAHVTAGQSSVVTLQDVEFRNNGDSVYVELNGGRLNLGTGSFTYTSGENHDAQTPNAKYLKLTSGTLGTTADTWTYAVDTAIGNITFDTTKQVYDAETGLTSAGTTGATMTMSGTVTAVSGFTVDGLGTLVFTGDVTGGAVTISSGTLQIGNNKSNSTNSFHVSSIDIAAGAQLKLYHAADVAGEAGTFEYESGKFADVNLAGTIYGYDLSPDNEVDKVLRFGTLTVSGEEAALAGYYNGRLRFGELTGSGKLTMSKYEDSQWHRYTYYFDVLRDFDGDIDIKEAGTDTSGHVSKVYINSVSQAEGKEATITGKTYSADGFVMGETGSETAIGSVTFDNHTAEGSFTVKSGTLKADKLTISEGALLELTGGTLGIGANGLVKATNATEYSIKLLDGTFGSYAENGSTVSADVTLGAVTLGSTELAGALTLAGNVDFEATATYAGALNITGNIVISAEGLEALSASSAARGAATYSRGTHGFLSGDYTILKSGGGTFTYGTVDTPKTSISVSGVEGIELKCDENGHYYFTLAGTSGTYFVRDDLAYANITAADKTNLTDIFIAKGVTLTFGSGEDNNYSKSLTLEGGTVVTSASLLSDSTVTLVSTDTNEDGHLVYSTNRIQASDCTMSGTVAGTGNLILKRVSEAFNVAGTIHHLGDLTLMDGVTVKSDAHIENAGTVTLQQGVNLESGATINNHGTLALEHYELNISHVGTNVTGFILSDGTLNASSGGISKDITLAGGDNTINISTSQQTLGGDITGEGNISLKGRITFGKSITHTGDLTLAADSTGSVIDLEGAKVNNTGNVAVTSGRVALWSGGSIGENVNRLIINGGHFEVDPNISVQVKGLVLQGNANDSQLRLKNAITVSGGAVDSDGNPVDALQLTGGRLSALSGVEQIFAHNATLGAVTIGGAANFTGGNITIGAGSTTNTFVGTMVNDGAGRLRLLGNIKVTDMSALTKTENALAAGADGFDYTAYHLVERAAGSTATLDFGADVTSKAVTVENFTSAIGQGTYTATVADGAAFITAYTGTVYHVRNNTEGVNYADITAGTQPAATGISLDGGKLNLGSGSANLPITVTAASSLSAVSDTTLAGNITAGGAGNAGGNLSIDSTGTGTDASFVLSGSVDIGTQNTLTINSGWVTFGSAANATNNITAGNILVNSGATLQIYHNPDDAAKSAYAFGRTEDGKVVYTDMTLNGGTLFVKALNMGDGTQANLTASAGITLGTLTVQGTTSSIGNRWGSKLIFEELSSDTTRGENNALKEVKLTINQPTDSGRYQLTFQSLNNYHGELSIANAENSDRKVYINGVHQDTGYAAKVSGTTLSSNGFTKTGAGSITFAGNHDSAGKTIAVKEGTLKVQSGNFTAGTLTVGSLADDDTPASSGTVVFLQETAGAQNTKATITATTLDIVNGSAWFGNSSEGGGSDADATNAYISTINIASDGTLAFNHSGYTYKKAASGEEKTDINLNGGTIYSMDQSGSNPSSFGALTLGATGDDATSIIRYKYNGELAFDKLTSSSNSEALTLEIDKGGQGSSETHKTTFAEVENFHGKITYTNEKAGTHTLVIGSVSQAADYAATVDGVVSTAGEGFAMSGEGSLTVGGFALNGEMRLESGTLNIGSGGITTVSGAKGAQACFDGGTLGANGDWTSAADVSLGAVTIADTITLDGETTDSGMITLSGRVTFTGTLINNGKLTLSGSLFVDDLLQLKHDGADLSDNGFATGRYQLIDGADDSSLDLKSNTQISVGGALTDLQREGNSLYVESSGNIFYIRTGAETYGGAAGTIAVDKAVSVYLEGENTTLNMAANLTGTATGGIHVQNNAAINLGTGVTLASSAVKLGENAGPLTLKGSGTYVLPSTSGSSLGTLSDIELDREWTGKLQYAGEVSDKALSGHTNANSWLELKGAYHYLIGGETHSDNIWLTNADDGSAALRVYNGYSYNQENGTNIVTLSGKVSGNGTFLRDNSKTPGNTVWQGGTPYYKFTGDVSAWEGEFRVENTVTNNTGITGTTYLEFTGSATEINAGIKNLTESTIKVKIDNASAVEVNSVMSGKTSVSYSGIGAKTVTGESSYTGGTTISAGEVKAASAKALGSGNVVVSNNAKLLVDSTTGLDLGKSATVTVNKGGSLVVKPVADADDANAVASLEYNTKAAAATAATLQGAKLTAKGIEAYADATVKSITGAKLTITSAYMVSGITLDDTEVLFGSEAYGKAIEFANVVIKSNSHFAQTGITSRSGESGKVTATLSGNNTIELSASEMSDLEFSPGLHHIDITTDRLSGLVMLEDASLTMKGVPAPLSYGAETVTLTFTGMTYSGVSEEYMGQEITGEALKQYYGNFRVNSYNLSSVIVGDVGNGVIGTKLTFTSVIPEPATATLSLLVLAACAARRRRRGAAAR